MKALLKLYNKVIDHNKLGFKQLFGVTKTTYETMLDQLRFAYAAKHQRREHESKLAREAMLCMALKYRHQ